MRIKKILTYWENLAFKYKLMISVALVHAVMMTFFGIFLMLEQSRFLLNQTREEAIDRSTAIAASSIPWVLSDDLVGLDNILKGYKHYSDIRYIFICDVDGKILAHWDNKLIGKYLSDQDSISILKSKINSEIMKESATTVDAVSVIKVENRIVGWVRISLNRNNINFEINKVLWISFISTLIAIALGALLAYLLSLQVVSKINKLLKVVEKTREGDRSSRTGMKSTDEIGLLAEGFDNMLDFLIDEESKYQSLSIRLQNLNAELDDYTYIVSHDLKEPLRAISNYSRFILEDYEEKLDSEGKRMIQVLISQTAKMNQLINILLRYSKIGRDFNSETFVDLNEVIEEITNDFQELMKVNNVYLAVDNNLPKIICNQVIVKEIFTNIIINAIKYNDKAEKHIVVGYKEDGLDKSKVFYVKDNGIGIKEEYFDTIFKIFKRLHGRDQYGGGSGAGLTIVKKMVEIYKGKIWVESEFGQGSTFYFTLEGEK